MCFLSFQCHRSGYVCAPDSEFSKTPPSSFRGGRGESASARAAKGGGKRAQVRSAAAEHGSGSKSFVDASVLAPLRKEFPLVSDRTLATLATMDEDRVNLDLIEELLRHIMSTSDDG